MEQPLEGGPLEGQITEYDTEQAEESTASSDSVTDQTSAAESEAAVSETAAQVEQTPPTEPDTDEVPAAQADDASAAEVLPEQEEPQAEEEPLAEAAADEEAEAAEEEAEPIDDGREWFVIHSYSGYENKVKQNLEQRIDSMNMQDRIFKVVVPTEEEIEIREGHRRKTKKRVFPGYILVQMVMDEESWYVVRNTPGVTGFVGSGTKPTALRPEEADKIFERMEMEAPKIKVSFREGQSVRIVDGPFTDFVGTVEELNLDKGKVRVLVSFFGRETPVELDFLQVQKQ